MDDLDVPRERALAQTSRGFSGAPAVSRAADARPAASLIERESETLALGAAFAAARSGNGRVVVIEGTDGAGRSALLAEAERRARVAGSRIVSARARTREQDAPFELVRRLLAPVVTACGPTTRAELFAGAVAPAARLFPPPDALHDDDAAGPPDDPGVGVEHGDALVHALRLLTQRVADLTRARRADAHGTARRRSGLVILVDDVQWADGCSLRVLAALGAEIATAPIALVVTCPAEGTSPHEALVRRLRAAPAKILTLCPLSAAGVVGWLRGTAPPAPADAVARRAGELVRDSGGNPLLLGELIAEDARRDRSTSPGGPRALSVHGLVARTASRIDRLSLGARAVLAALAVLGDDSTVTETAALTGPAGPSGPERPSIDTAVVELVAARLLAAPPPAAGDERLRFAHPLVATAVCSELDPAAHARDHRRAARIRHDAGAPPAVVAFHLAHCAPAEDPDAATWLADAARRAAGLGHLRGVRALADRGLDEQPPPGLARRLRVDRALAGAVLGAADAADQLELVLAETETPAHRAALLLALGRVLFTSKHFEAAGRALARARSELGGADDSPGSFGTWQLLRDELATTTFRPDARGHAAARLPALVTEAAGLTGAESVRPAAGLFAQYAVQRAALGAPRAEVRDLAVRGLDGGGVRSELGFADLGVSGDYFHDLRAGMSVMALLAVDEFDLAHTAIEKVLARAQDHGSLVGLGFASHWRALLRLRRGHLSGAVSDAERTLGVCRIGWDVCRNSVVPILAVAHLDSGRTDAAVRALALADPLDPDGDPVITQPGLVLEARGRVAAARGAWSQAHRLFLDAGAREREQSGIDPAPTIVPWRSQAAVAAARIGHLDEARTLAGEELEIARGIGAPRALAVALLSAAEVVRAAAGDQGRAMLAEAVDLLEDSQATLDRARSLVAHGTALVAGAGSPRDRDAGRDLLERGLGLAERCGARTLADRAVRSLRAAGGRRRPVVGTPTPTTVVTALTRTERQIAELAADHLSTPAIARTLYVSPKTIEWHLTNAYRKLGVRSRRDLPAALEDTRRTG
jgi:DNA-binding CsgD family transcriptional regulator/tetratricopeptide (TPR) repeat protein